jgi:hypothetical protein
MFWFKKLKRNLPEEIKNPKPKQETKIENLSFKDIDYITEAIVKALACRTDPLVRLIIHNIKSDEKFFNAFINFLERSENKHDIFLAILKTNFIESCKKVFSK